jgi:predicted RNA binding protein YcfA (HicA-like mRNA interferase family)
MSARKLWERVRSGSRNLSFRELVTLAEVFGFRHTRTSGSHQIFAHPTVPAMLNFQPDRDGSAKRYQIRQLITLIEQYGLRLPGEAPDGEGER